MIKKSPLLIGFLVLSVSALAGFIPLWFDAPIRNNVNDPFTKRPTFVNAVPSPAAPCLNTALYNFESSAQGWTNATTFDTAITAVSASSAKASDCLQSLALTVSLTGIGTDQGGIASVGGAGFPKNLTANTIISADLYVPLGMPSGNGAFIYIKIGASYLWTPAAWTNLPSTGGWTTLTFDISSIAGRSMVQEIGIKIGQGGCPSACVANWSGICYLDKVDIQ